jgi:hypothetical protein
MTMHSLAIFYVAAIEVIESNFAAEIAVVETVD